jgi:hypothetical protein
MKPLPPYVADPIWIVLAANLSRALSVFLGYSARLASKSDVSLPADHYLS